MDYLCVINQLRNSIKPRFFLKMDFPGTGSGFVPPVVSVFPQLERLTWAATSAISAKSLVFIFIDWLSVS